MVKIFGDAFSALDDTSLLIEEGIDSTLVFGEELELPYFATFHPLESCKGMAELYSHFIAEANTLKRSAPSLTLRD